MTHPGIVGRRQLRRRPEPGNGCLPGTETGPTTFLEGEAGVGKTEIAKVLANCLGRRLIRLQCYEGLDVSGAVYEWNYPRQMIAIRLAEAGGEEAREQLAAGIFGPEFLIRRPLLTALEPQSRKDRPYY